MNIIREALLYQRHIFFNVRSYPTQRIKLYESLDTLEQTTLLKTQQYRSGFFSAMHIEASRVVHLQTQIRKRTMKSIRNNSIFPHGFLASYMITRYYCKTNIIRLLNPSVENHLKLPNPHIVTKDNLPHPERTSHRNTLRLLNSTSIFKRLRMNKWRNYTDNH